MKFLIIFCTSFLSSQIFGQQEISNDTAVYNANYDTVIVNNRYVGVVKLISVKKEFETGQIWKDVLYNVYLDKPISPSEKREIKKRFNIQNPAITTRIDFVDRFNGSMNKNQLIGMKISNAGILMTQRNNWRIFGTLATTGIILIGAGTGTGVVLSVLVGTTSLIVSTVKDYHANNLLIEAGELMKE